MFQWGALPRGLWACSEADLGDMPQRGCWREAQSEMQEMRKIPVGDDGRYQRCASFIMFIWLVHLEITISEIRSRAAADAHMCCRSPASPICVGHMCCSYVSYDYHNMYCLVDIVNIPNETTLIY